MPFRLALNSFEAMPPNQRRSLSHDGKRSGKADSLSARKAAKPQYAVPVAALSARVSSLNRGVVTERHPYNPWLLTV